MLLRKIALLGAAFYTLGLFLERDDDDKSLMLRGYARDQFADPSIPGFETASAISAQVGLPIGWVLALQAQVPSARLVEAAEATKRAFVRPASSGIENLTLARSSAIQAGVAHVTN